jgi:hypothetical protein
LERSGEPTYQEQLSAWLHEHYPGTFAVYAVSGIVICETEKEADRLLAALGEVACDEAVMGMDFTLRLEQLSISLSRQGVSGVGEPRDRIIAGDRVDRQTHRLH